MGVSPVLSSQWALWVSGSRERIEESEGKKALGGVSISDITSHVHRTSCGVLLYMLTPIWWDPHQSVASLHQQIYSWYRLSTCSALCPASLSSRPYICLLHRDWFLVSWSCFGTIPDSTHKWLLTLLSGLNLSDAQEILWNVEDWIQVGCLQGRHSPLCYLYSLSLGLLKQYLIYILKTALTFKENT